ncbi:MAG: Na+/H+ antiporter [Alphaproteobacteria bacterium]|nr:Na+/H+ antiporter [Alphaproteobacteria bacterium]
MSQVEVILVLMTCAVALAWAAERLKLPYPVPLTLGGLALGFVPGLPELEFDPAWLLPIVLPPILYQAAIFTSWRDFKRHLRSISMLAVGLVIVTTLAIAATAKAILPELPWAACFVLGAVLSPPDAVAATAVLSRLKVPRRVVTILEGESLVNDATGLVLYKFAVAAALTGAFSLAEATATFVGVAAGGLAIGAALGWAAVWAYRHMGDSQIELLLSLVLPYAAYLAAEHVHASGVLAVVALGLMRGWHAPEVFSAETRVQAHAMWGVVVFALNGLIFILIGLQLPAALDSVTDWTRFALQVGAISLTAILVRMAWVFPGAFLPRLLSRHVRETEPKPSKREVTIVGWCGMRGIVSLAAVLAVPLLTGAGEPFPGRQTLILLTFATIVVTLVLNGLTLAPLIRFLGVGADAHAEEEERLARLKINHAALAALDSLSGEGTQSPAAIAAVRLEYQQQARRAEALDPTTGGEAGTVRAVRMAAVAAARRRLVKLRREGQIGDEALHRIQRELDLEEWRLSH